MFLSVLLGVVGCYISYAQNGYIVSTASRQANTFVSKNRCLLHKFTRPFWKKKYALTARRLENFWQTLNGGELSLTIVVYIAANVLCWITVKRAITRAS